MSPFKLIVPLRKRRDLLLARRKARQVASFLGFDVWNIITIAAATMDLAQKVFDLGAGGVIEFEFHERSLSIGPGDSSKTNGDLSHPACRCATQLHIQLPEERVAKVAVEDIPWIIEQVEELEKNVVWEETIRQNQEVLALLLEIKKIHAKKGAAGHAPQDFAA